MLGKIFYVKKKKEIRHFLKLKQINLKGYRQKFNFFINKFTKIKLRHYQNLVRNLRVQRNLHATGVLEEFDFYLLITFLSNCLLLLTTLQGRL